MVRVDYSQISNGNTDMIQLIDNSYLVDLVKYSNATENIV
jgi:hypothetical protein